jgi:SAM-dependent methyltransferase
MKPKSKPDNINHSPKEVSEKILNRNFSVLEDYSLEYSFGTDGIHLITNSIKNDKSIYQPLITGTISHKGWYDWNLGFLLRGLNLEWLTEIIDSNSKLLLEAESLAWALGEIGSDDERIVNFLYKICENCLNYDAWWCAADALEKLKVCDATDLKKRTLKGNEWNDLEYCFNNLSNRAAVIGILKHARLENTQKIIVPKCRDFLKSNNSDEVQNAVWLLERLRIDDNKTIHSLLDLYEIAEDQSHTLKPRIVEALGQIASPETRHILEEALFKAKYYRTRAYAAMGLGKIGDKRSVDVLKKSLEKENDDGVIGYITQALYSIENKIKNKINHKNKILNWPENGMIFDFSDDWYTNAEIYDKFSYAEDPLNISLDFCISRIPDSAKYIADLGTGTGRLSIHICENIPDVKKVYALDINKSMIRFLKNKIVHDKRLNSIIKTFNKSINNLPFKNNSIDVVVSNWAFPSKMWDLDTCLIQVKEVYRVLKPGGILITIGWDESFRDELSELWYRFVPEPDFRRESFEDWRKRRKSKILSARNCHLTFIKKNVRVPLLFENPYDAANVLGFLFGYTAGEWVINHRKSEFSINIGITYNTREQLLDSIDNIQKDISGAFN